MELTEEEYAYLLEWIKTNIIPSEKFSETYGESTMVKNLFEFSKGNFYANEDYIKKAMLECGFRVKNQRAFVWVFNVSKHSPAFKEPSVQKKVCIPPAAR